MAGVADSGTGKVEVEVEVEAYRSIVKFGCGTLNLDHTKKIEGIDKDSFADTMTTTWRKLDKPAILGWSEVGFAYRPRVFCEANPELDYCDANFFRQDRTAILWDASRVSTAEETKTGRVCSPTISDMGRYMATHLHLPATEENGLDSGGFVQLAIQVHMPHKDSSKKHGKGLKQRSYRLLSKFVEEYKGEVDGILIIGDFNARPSQVKEYLPELHMLFDSEEDESGQRRIDNILYDGVSVSNPLELRDSPFEHRPIAATVSIIE